MKHLLCLLAAACCHLTAGAQDYIRDDGNFQQSSYGNTNNNFNKLRNDTTQDKEIPTGLYVWTIDRKDYIFDKFATLLK